MGQGKGLIRAGGNVHARLINAAEVDATGSVAVDTEIVNANVAARGWVRVGGRIVGGHVRARDGIEAQVLGSASGGRTIVQVEPADDPGEPPVPRDGPAPNAKAAPSERGRKVALGQVNNRSPGSRITVRQTIYPGVHLTIHGLTRKIEAATGGGTYRKEEGEIRLFPT